VLNIISETEVNLAYESLFDSCDVIGTLIHLLWLRMQCSKI